MKQKNKTTASHEASPEGGGQLAADQCRKIGVDRRVALLLDMPLKDVVDVTSVFLDVVMKKLIEQGEIHLQGFGTFRLQAYEGKLPALEEVGMNLPRSLRTFRTGVQKTLVRFKKSEAFRRQIKKAEERILAEIASVEEASSRDFRD